MHWLWVTLVVLGIALVVGGIALAGIALALAGIALALAAVVIGIAIALVAAELVAAGIALSPVIQKSSVWLCIHKALAWHLKSFSSSLESLSAPIPHPPVHSSGSTPSAPAASSASPRTKANERAVCSMRACSMQVQVARCALATMTGVTML